MLRIDNADLRLTPIGRAAGSWTTSAGPPSRRGASGSSATRARAEAARVTIDGARVTVAQAMARPTTTLDGLRRRVPHRHDAGGRVVRRGDVRGGVPVSRIPEASTTQQLARTRAREAVRHSGRLRVCRHSGAVARGRRTAVRGASGDDRSGRARAGRHAGRGRDRVRPSRSLLNHGISTQSGGSPGGIARTPLCFVDGSQCAASTMVR